MDHKSASKAANLRELHKIHLHPISKLVIETLKAKALKQTLRIKSLELEAPNQILHYKRFESNSSN